ncbi:MAG TPA: HEAT repeat domain-containing protein [Candidatus Wallbacteria bacterium]|nr:HEAT repeat domain-containing protein [Candidatus Wallbacteria bacterium]HPG57593.1 HEAT repeat domain-containing protein [Candidatus Wallbacteria bacterium]
MANNDITELLFHLSSNDYKIKIKAVDDLGKSSSIEAYEALKLLLKKNDVVLRPHIKNAIGEIESSLKKNNLDILDKIGATPAGEKKSENINYEAFNRFINDEEPKNRIAAISACSKLGRDERLEQMLIDRLSEENHPFVIASILINLGRAGSEKCADIIASFLTHPDARVRANAVEGLDYLQAPAAVQHILNSAADGDPRVRANVARALLSVDIDYVENLLLSMINSGEQTQIEAAGYVIDKIKFKFKKTPVKEDESRIKSGDALQERPADATHPREPVKTALKIADAPPEKKTAGFQKYAALFAVSVMAALIYHSYIKNDESFKTSGSTASSESSANYGAYEIELKSKIDSIISEAERAIAAKNPRDAFTSLLQLKKVSPDNNIIKILEAEIKILEQKYRDALSVLKQVPAGAKTSRYYYLLAACYFTLKNYNDAAAFGQLAIKNEQGGTHRDLANALVEEIKKIRAAQLKEASILTEKSLNFFYSSLNDEGPKVLRQYFINKKYYDLFEYCWRVVLLEVKQWKIDYRIVNLSVIEQGGGENKFNAKVLETWQYQNYGGICWLAYHYRDFHFIITPPDHAFDTGSVRLEAVISELEEINFNHEKPEEYERKYKNELLLAKAVNHFAEDATASVDLLKKARSQAPESAALILETLTKPGFFNKKELDELYSSIKKRSANDKFFDFFSGGENLKSTLLNLIANCYLDLNDKAAHVKILDEIISENPKFANAHFEKAVSYYNDSNTEKCSQAVAKALEIEPDFPALDSFFFPEQYRLNNEIMTRAEENFDQGLIDDLEKLIKNHPAYWRSLFNTGKLMMMINADDKAEIFFTRALKLSPGNCSALAKLALCYYRMKDHKRAAETAAAAEKLEPFNFQVKRTRLLVNR